MATEDDKRKALLTMQQLNASAIYEKLKMEMRSSGIKKIPRGLREAQGQILVQNDKS
jgi:hypothetical protein